MWLTACSGGSSDALMAPAPTLARLPTVTPAPTLNAGERQLLENSSSSRLSFPAPKTASVIATTPPAVTESEHGPITPSMAQLKIDGEQYATMGDPAAPVTIVEFSDYGCPFCRLYNLTTLSEIKTKYIATGQVYYVHKDLPVVSLRGDLAAQAAECAGHQGRYWDMHTKLFIEPAEWEGTVAQALDSFRRYAAMLELDAAGLEQCVAAGDYAATVERNIADAQALRLSGTPVFLLTRNCSLAPNPLRPFSLSLTPSLPHNHNRTIRKGLDQLGHAALSASEQRLQERRIVDIQDTVFG
jgi:protein-disulfide isomerase